MLTTDEVRIIGLCAPQLFKLLRQREERLLKKMYGEFRSGNRALLTVIAEWASVRDQLNEITNVLNQHTKQEEISHATANS